MIEEEINNKIKTIDPFDIDDDFSWLELNNIPENIYNPLLNFEIGKQKNPTDEIISYMMDYNYLHFSTKHLLNIELLPFQLVILDTLWRKRLPILVASRGGGKSFILAVYSLLRMVFHPGCKVVIVGAAFRQSRQVYEYMSAIWEKAPVLRDISGVGKTIGPRREIDRCQFTIGNSTCVALPLGDGSKIRGQRGNYIIADEYSSIPEEIFNVVVQGFGVVASNPVDKVKEFALINKLKKMGIWTEEMERLRIKQSTGNQIIYSGTAFYEFNHFCRQFKKWHMIIKSKGDIKKIMEMMGGESIPDGFNYKDYAILRIPYSAIPQGLLDMGILAQAKATLSHNQFLMEYCGIFVADSDGFYKRSIIESATTNKPILISDGKYIQFSASRHGDKDRRYVLAIDPAADQDNAAIVILELHPDHRRIVHCWTTNKSKYNKLKKQMRQNGVEISDDYYHYIVRKVRELMKVFNIERIIMDKHGGGTAIAEAMGSKNTCQDDEFPIYEIIDPNDPKSNDMEKGLHILELIAPTQELNSEANHGMLKDLQDRILLFPLFDTIEIEKAIQLDNINKLIFDTYEDLVQEIEEIKNEMTTIVVTQSSSLGKESFDTPSVKTENSKKGHLRKDRYSALLYANYYARNKDKQTVVTIQYKPVGGTKETISSTKTVKNEGFYSGPGILKFGQSPWIINPGHCFTKKNFQN